jgi:hypothetical protein
MAFIAATAIVLALLAFPPPVAATGVTSLTPAPIPRGESAGSGFGQLGYPQGARQDAWQQTNILRNPGIKIDKVSG